MTIKQKFFNWLEGIPSDEYLVKLERNKDVKRLIKVLHGYGYSTAAEVLGRLHAKEAVQPMMDLLPTRDEFARYAFIKALGEIGDPRALPALREALSDKDSSVRSAAGNAIAKIQSSSSSNESTSKNIESLIAILVNNKYNWETRGNAATSLSKLGKSAVNPLCKILTHYDSEVRWQAAEALGIIKDKQSLESLIPLLNDSDRVVQMHAALAIGKLGDNRGVHILVKQLSNFTGYVLWDAIDQLGDFQDPTAVDPLNKLLNDSNSKTREKAAIALGKIPKKSS